MSRLNEIEGSDAEIAPAMQKHTAKAMQRHRQPEIAFRLHNVSERNGPNPRHKVIPIR
jgi:hypothetical protein